MKHVPSMRVLLLCLISAWSSDTFSSFDSNRKTFPVLPTEVWLYIFNYASDSKLILTCKQLYVRYKPCIHPLSRKVDFTDIRENTPKCLFFQLIAQNRLAVYKESLSIDLGNVKASIQHFMHALNQNTEIKSLTLGCHSNFKAVQIFFPLFNVNTTIKKLCLDQIKIQDNCAAQLNALLCTNTTLTQLDLKYINSAGETTTALAEGLHKNKTVRVLNLFGHHIESSGILNVANMLMVNTVLQKLRACLHDYIIL